MVFVQKQKDHKMEVILQIQDIRLDGLIQDVMLDIDSLLWTKLISPAHVKYDKYKMH